MVFMQEEIEKNKAHYLAELAKESRADVKKLRSEQAATLLQFKSDLTESTEHVYDKLSKDNAAQEAALSNLPEGEFGWTNLIGDFVWTDFFLGFGWALSAALGFGRVISGLGGLANRDG